MAKKAAKAANKQAGEPEARSKGRGGGWSRVDLVQPPESEQPETADSPKASTTAVAEAGVVEKQPAKPVKPVEPVEPDDDDDDYDDDYDDDDWDDEDDDDSDDEDGDLDDDADDDEDGDGDESDDDSDDADDDDDWDDADIPDDDEWDAASGPAPHAVDDKGAIESPRRRRLTLPTGRMDVEEVAFPTPPARKLTWDKFRQYWRNVYDDVGLRPRLRVYVYRMWPVMIKGHSQVARLEGDPAQGDKRLLAAPLTIDDILHRWGSGSYSIRLNDAGAPRARKEVCMCVLEGKAELMDFDHYPPVIDYDKLDPDNPVNQTFIKGMKNKKWADDDEDREESMSQVLQFAEKVLDRERARGQESSASSTDKASLDLVVHSAKQSIDMITQQAAKAGGNTTDTLQLVQTMMGMFREMQQSQQQNSGKKDGDDTWLKLYMQSQENERAARAENVALLKETLTALVTQRQEPEKKPETLASKVEEFRALRELSRDMFGGRSRDTGGTDWGEMAMKFAPMLMPLFGTLQQLLTSMAQKHGVPASQLPPPMDPQQQMQQLQGIAQPPQPVAQPGEPFAPIAGVPAEFQSPQAIEMFLDSLKDPLIRHVNSFDGVAFAEWYIGWKGEEHYEALRQVGVDVLMTMLQSHHGIWSQLYSREKMVRQFVEQFVADPEDSDDDQYEDDAEMDAAEAQEELAESYRPIAEEAARITLRRRADESRRPEQGSVAVADQPEPQAAPTIDMKPENAAPKKASKRVSRKSS